MGGVEIVWVKQSEGCFGKLDCMTRFKNSLNPEVARTKLPKDGDLTPFHSLITDWKYKFTDIFTQQLEKYIYCVFSSFRITTYSG